MPGYRMHGMSDNTDTCELCGNIELRRVVMLAALDADGNTEAIIYAGTTCAARKLSTRGTRTTATRVRDAASAAGRVWESARAWADEFAPLTPHQFREANATAALNATHGNVAAALELLRVRYDETMAEVAAIRAGNLDGTRFAKRLPTL